MSNSPGCLRHFHALGRASWHVTLMPCPPANLPCLLSPPTGIHIPCGLPVDSSTAVTGPASWRCGTRRSCGRRAAIGAGQRTQPGLENPPLHFQPRECSRAAAPGSGLAPCRRLASIDTALHAACRPPPRPSLSAILLRHPLAPIFFLVSQTQCTSSQRHECKMQCTSSNGWVG